MNPVFRVIEPGARTLVQDQGFRNARGIGLPACGALDRTAMRLVCALLGNPAQSEVLEMALSAPTLRAEGETRAIAEWTATCLNDGDELHLAPPLRGAVAVLGIGGGLDLSFVRGSRSTCDKAGFGGFKGRSLAKGDLLPVGVSGAMAGQVDRRFSLPLRPETGPICVVAGPQTEIFTEAAYATFFGTGHLVTPRMDRMGRRLDAQHFEHTGPGAADIISDGAAPGAIQVSGNGLPIILLADAQTTGGYPKIVTVTRVDLPRLAACVPGDMLRFIGVTVAEAEAAARAQDRHLVEVEASIIEMAGTSRDLVAFFGPEPHNRHRGHDPPRPLPRTYFRPG